MKAVIFGLLAVCAAALPLPAHAGGGRHVVTSIQKCYDALGAEAAAEIRRKYLKPYQECQRRLAEKKAAESEAAAKAETPAAVTPRNYVRVQPEKEPPAKKEPAP